MHYEEWNERPCVIACFSPYWHSIERMVTSVYFITAEKWTWPNAEYTCLTLGGHLATIETEEEQSFLSHKLKASKKKFRCDV